MYRQKPKIYDVIIIGSGPAGMTAGIYTARRNMKTLIIGKEVGGQMSKIILIENYPGLKTTNGIDLAFKMKEQVKSLEVEFEIREVNKIRNQKSEIRNQNNLFEIKTKEKDFLGKSVILAFGLEKRKLGLENEKKFEGNGLSYCINCDGPLYKGKNVAVVGGGNCGAEAVEFLAQICPKVYWLEIFDKLKAEPILINRIKKLDNVEILLSTEITELIGREKLQSIRLGFKTHANVLRQDQDTPNKLDVEGLFVEIGYLAKTDWLKDLVELDKYGQIKVDKLCRTNMPGIFAAGDVTNVKYKQIVVAEGMGAIAALEAYKYTQSNR